MQSGTFREVAALQETYGKVFRKERLRGQYLTALPCQGTSITLSPMSPAGSQAQTRLT